MKKMDQRRYFNIIFLWISICFIALQIFFSITVFTQTNKSILNNNFEMNHQIFSQINQNIEKSDTVIKNICKALYVDPRVNIMMNGIMPEDDIYDWICDFQNICNPIQLGNPEVHSIYIYNSQMNRIFSSYRYLNFEDDFFKEIFTPHHLPTILTPILRYVDDPNSAGKARVFTYVLYENILDNGLPEGAIIVNVKADTIINNISALNTFSQNETSNILVFDNQNDFIADDYKSQKSSAAAVEEVKQFLNTKESTNQRFTMDSLRVDNVKYTAFTNHIASINWTVVKLQPYSEVFQYITTQRLFMLIITLIFCIVLLFIAYFLSKRIYKPIGDLVSIVKVTGNATNDVNEITFLSKTYQKMVDEIKNYKEAQPETDRILTSYFKESLIIDSINIDSNSLEALKEEHPDLFVNDNAYIVCVIAINNYVKHVENNNKKDRDLIAYALGNITQELLSNHFSNMFVALQDGQFAIVVKADTQQYSEHLIVLENIFAEANNYMMDLFQVSYTVSISSCAMGIKEITRLYKLAAARLSYRYILGDKAIISDKIIANNDKNIVFDLESSIAPLLGHIKSANKNAISADFENIYCSIQKLNFNNIMNFIMLLVAQVVNEITQMNKNKVNNVESDYSKLYAQFLSLENWTEISSELKKLIFNVIDDTEISEQKDHLLISTIKKIIDENYSDSALGLQQIGDMIKMSPQYVGRTFKNETQMTITEYIREIRLLKSIELLSSKKYTITEVISKVGIESESQYYRLFKKRFNTTPKGYLLENFE